MISASKEFKEKLKRSRVPLVNYADVTLSDGTVLHLQPKDFRIGGCTIEDKTTDGGKFGVGFVIGKTLSIRLENGDDRFSQYDFFSSIINIYVAMLLDDGTIEKIRKGVYYTLVPETPGDVIEISAVDGMYKLDKDYSESSTIYPATLQTILTDACIDCGIPIGFAQFDNMDFVVEEKPDKGTYRQIVSWACQISGYNARIDNDGYMQLVWYNTALLDQRTYDGGIFSEPLADTVLDGGKFGEAKPDLIIDGGKFEDESPEHIFHIKSLSVSTDDVQITGVRVVNGEEKNVLFGEEGYLIEVVENPFVSGKEDQVADYLGNRMVGMVFRPFSAEILGNPLYEPFDVVKASDRKGNLYISILNFVSFTIGSHTQVACEAEDPVRNGSTYVSAAAQAVVEARRNTEKQLTAYNKAVQSMNELAANAMGLFRKEELQPNGSYIYYESDRPITVDEDGKCHFEENSHVWMSSDAGFFASEDGGKTFTAGLDKNNNAVLNVLYAIGIVADWIRSGRFEITKDGKTMVLMDFDTKQVILRPDVFELSSGKTIESIAQEKSDAALNIAKEYTNGELLTYSSAVSSSFKVTNDSIAAEVTRATKAEGIIDGNIKKVDETLSAKIELTEKGLSSKVNNSEFSSLFKQEAKGIVLGVTNNKDSSEISLSGAGIEAQSKTIKFTGNVVFASNLTNGTTKVSGDNIYSGTISGTDFISRGEATIGSILNAVYVKLTDGEVVFMSSDLNKQTPQYRRGGVRCEGYGMTFREESTANGVSGYIFYISGYSVSGPAMYLRQIAGTVDMHVSGKISSSSTKSRVSETDNYSDRLLYCYEMPAPMFGDIGEAETDDAGQCYIYLDDVFSETIAAEIEYQVFLQKEGPGDIWVEEKNSIYFLVKGTENLKFAWEIKAKQKGFEFDRLEYYDKNPDEQAGIEYESEYMEEINRLIQEREGILYETA